MGARDKAADVLQALGMLSQLASNVYTANLQIKDSLLDRQYKEKMTNKALEIEASKSLYNENVKLYHDAKTSLDKLELAYGDSVGSIENLDNMYQSSGLEVASNIYEGEATDFQERADLHLKNAQALQNKINIVQQSLFGDIKRAKNIIAGGAGLEGGVDPEGWDLDDLGILAYETQFGESSDTVKALFKNNPGMMTSSLAALQKTEEAMNLSKQKREYYSDKEAESVELTARNEAELTFGSLINSAAITSGKQQFDGLSMIAANFDDTTPNEDITSVENSKMKVRVNVGKDFAFLIGETASEEQYFDYANDYFEMHDLSKGQSAVRQGRIGYGNWSIFNNYVQQASNNYIKAVQSGDSSKIKILNELAMKYFGMPKGILLSTFANDLSSHFSNTILSSFNNENQVDSTETNLDSLNFEDLDAIEDQKWQKLLED